MWYVKYTYGTIFLLVPIRIRATSRGVFDVRIGSGGCADAFHATQKRSG